MPDQSQGQTYPNQQYGWVREDDGTWSLYAPDGIKVIGSENARAQVSVPLSSGDIASKDYVDTHGGGMVPFVGVSPPSNPTDGELWWDPSDNTPISGLPWGESSTAQFSGSGSPVGVVTPSGEGDLYVDDTTPALWQASGATSSDWQQVAGGDITASDINSQDAGSGYVITADGEGGSNFEAPGGGSQPYAWIGSDIKAPIDNPTSSTVVVWGAVTQEGTPGWTLSMDGKTWTCTVAGAYLIHIEPSWTLNHTSDQVQATCQLNATVADVNSPINQTYGGRQVVLLSAVTAGTYEFVVPWSLPSLEFAFGDSFTFSVQTVNGATDTADFSNSNDMLITPA